AGGAVGLAAVHNLTPWSPADGPHDGGRARGVAPGDPATTRHNPAVYAPAWRTPTLVTHGEKDYRVPVEHAHELYGMLKARRVPARLVIYPEETHWITKPQSSLHWYGEVLNWLARYLT